jgi:hypothetical protein
MPPRQAHPASNRRSTAPCTRRVAWALLAFLEHVRVVGASTSARRPCLGAERGGRRARPGLRCGTLFVCTLALASLVGVAGLGQAAPPRSLPADALAQNTQARQSTEPPSQSGAGSGGRRSARPQAPRRSRPPARRARPAPPPARRSASCPTRRPGQERPDSGFQWGLRAGIGSGLWSGTTGDYETETFLLGAAVRLPLGPLTIEGNALWHRAQTETRHAEAVTSRLALPILVKVGIPLAGERVVLGLGLGLEPRWLLASDGAHAALGSGPASSTLHLPIAVGVDVDLILGTLNLELRYAHQLEGELERGEARQHELMLLAGVFF